MRLVPGCKDRVRCQHSQHERNSGRQHCTLGARGSAQFPQALLPAIHCECLGVMQLYANLWLVLSPLFEGTLAKVGTQLSPPVPSQQQALTDCSCRRALEEQRTCNPALSAALPCCRPRLAGTHSSLRQLPGGCHEQGPCRAAMYPPQAGAVPKGAAWLPHAVGGAALLPAWAPA